MKTIFSKNTYGRKPLFQINTSILSDGKKKYVLKRGIYSADHVNKMLDHYQKLSEVYGKEFVSFCKKEDEGVGFEFIEGRSLEEIALSDFTSAIAIFETLLKRNESQTEFKASKEFKAVFGSSSYQGKASKVSNVDLTFSNIIVEDNNQPVITDYEWCFDFAIPNDLVAYRSLSLLEETHPELKEKIAEEYQKLGMNDLTSLKAMFDHFYSYVLLEGIDRRKGSHYIFSAIEEAKKEEDRLNQDIVKLGNWGKELTGKVDSLNGRITSLQEEVEIKNNHIHSLLDESERKDNQIHSYQESLDNKEKELAEKSVELATKCRELFEKKDQIDRLSTRVDILNEDIKEKAKQIDSQSQRIITLQKEEEDRNLHIAKLDKEIDWLRVRSGRLNEIETSTMYKLAKRYYKVRDFLIPMGSKRKMFLKLFGKMIRHPIWTIRHLTPTNVSKFKKYSHSEGLMRALERTDVYQNNNIQSDFAKTLELVDMNPREEYPVLEFPKFKKPLVSIIIPVYNQFSYTYGCLVSILKQTKNVPYEVILGDDCSTDETKDIKKCIKSIKVARTKTNSRFLLNCNNAAKEAKGEYIFFLNNDVNVQPNYLSSLLETIQSDKNIGMVGSKLVYPDGSLQEAGGILWKDGSAWNYGYHSDANASEYNYRKEVDYISGAAIMIKKSLWDEIGGFDTRYVPAYNEDSDLAFEVRKHGYKVVYDPFSTVVHYEGVSNGTDTSTGLKKYQVDNTKKFYEKWKEVLSSHYPNGENVFVARERSFNKKKVLVIDHYVPTYDKDAGSRTVFAYLKLFVRLGYEVKFMGENFYQSEPYTDTLEKLGIEVLYGPYYFNHWKEWIKMAGGNFDLVLFNRPHITKKFIDDVMVSCPKAKFLYYGHDLHYVRLSREYEVTKNEKALKEAQYWKEEEWKIFKKVDLVLYPSQVEIDEIKKEDPKLNAKVLQPYLFEDIQYKDYDFKARKDIMFVGGFTHGPNFDGIMWFIKDIFPSIHKVHPEMKLIVAGSNAPQALLDEQNEYIKVTGYISDEELNHYYSTVKMIVVPLRFGAGIKGKVIEAMDKNVPVITTSCGAEGINSDALVVDESLLKLNDLYDDEEKLKEISKKEYEFIRDVYSMEAAEKSLKQMIADLKK